MILCLLLKKNVYLYEIMKENLYKDGIKGSDSRMYCI